MMYSKSLTPLTRIGLVPVVLFVLFILSGCSPAPVPTPVLPTATAIPVPPIPTLTLVPPTLTPVPPTATQVPPTATHAPTTKPTASPTAISELSPSPRGYISMAYDSQSKRVILFGGQTGDYRRADSYNDETWAFDMTTSQWTRMKPDLAPSGRGAAELAYDAESDRIIMYGGANAGMWGLNETWAYDYNKNTWTKKANGPALHLGGRMTYDVESDRIILFAGYNVNSDKYYNDTWAYDFNSDTWTEMTPKSSPGGRNYHAMTYDSKADRVILWGGDVGLEPDADIWAYDYNANKWQEMKSSGGPSAEIEDYPTLAYDTESDQTILYHGKETWAYDYNTNAWKNMVPTPAPRFLKKNALTYSPDADQVVLFGGETIVYSGETWVYDFNTNTWTNVTPQP